jgi:hypothetical protein
LAHNVSYPLVKLTGRDPLRFVVNVAVSIGAKLLPVFPILYGLSAPLASVFVLMVHVIPPVVSSYRATA